MKNLTKWALALVMLLGLTFTACEKGEVTHDDLEKFNIENVTFVRVFTAGENYDADWYCKFNLDGSFSSWIETHDGEREVLYDDYKPTYSYDINTLTAYLYFPEWDEDENGAPIPATDTITFKLNNNGTVTLYETLDLWGCQNCVSIWTIYNGTCPNTHPSKTENTTIYDTWTMVNSEYDEELGAYLYEATYTFNEDGTIVATDRATSYGEIVFENTLEGTFTIGETNIVIDFGDDYGTKEFIFTRFGNNIIGLGEAIEQAPNGVAYHYYFRNLAGVESTLLGTWIESPEMCESYVYTVMQFNADNTFKYYRAMITDEGVEQQGDGTSGCYRYYEENRGLELLFAINSLDEVTDTTRTTFYGVGEVGANGMALIKIDATSDQEPSYEAWGFNRIAK